MEHHVHRIKPSFMLRQFLHQVVRDLIVGIGPLVNDLVVPLIVGYQTHVVVLPNFIHLFLSHRQRPLFDAGRDQVSQVKGQSAPEGPGESHFFDVIQECGGCWNICTLNNASNDLLQALLGKQFIDIRYFFGNTPVEDNPANRRFYTVRGQIASAPSVRTRTLTPACRSTRFSLYAMMTSSGE